MPGGLGEASQGLAPQLCPLPCWPGGGYSPAAHDEAQRLQVAMVGSPERGGHAILVGGIQLLPGGLLEEFQVTIPGGPVVLIIHGARLARGGQGAQGNAPRGGGQRG